MITKKHKVIHTYNVVKMIDYISDDLGLSEEDKNFALSYIDNQIK